MPLPLAAAGIALARKAALSKVRRGAKKQIKKSAEGITKSKSSGKKTKKDISWLEIGLVIIFVALPNDLIDVFNLTIVGKLVTIFIEPITLFFLFAWFWVRVREKPSRRIVKSAITFVAEIIPFIGLLPLWTLLVINVKTGWLDKFLAIPMKLLSFGK